MEPPDKFWKSLGEGHWINMGLADIQTTQLGLWAFEGKEELVLANGPIDWEIEGTKVLMGAILGKHLGIAKKLLELGSPVDRNIYAVTLDHLPEFLPLLPLNENVVKDLRKPRQWMALNWAIVRGELEKVRALLPPSQPINGRVMLTHGMGTLSPIHYAVRNGNPEIIKLIVEAGADVNLLNEKGQSPLRALLENLSITSKERREGFAFLKQKEAEAIPPLETTFDKICAYLGWKMR